MMEDLRQVEATGETVGEAKWAALRELEKLHPGLDKGAVRFQVVSEGERGLLGVGYAPARVVALVDAESAQGSTDGESDLAGEVRDLVERITTGIGIRCRHRHRRGRRGDHGLVLGLEPRALDRQARSDDRCDPVPGERDRVARDPDGRKDVVVDAAGYRDRRRTALEALAIRSAEEALATHSSVELEPMTAVERKTVHLRLKEYDGVETGSEGTEPNRFIVITPSA